MEMLLEAPNVSVKNKWLHAFRREEDPSGGFRGQHGRLLAECYLVKVQPMGTTSKTRWFVLTDRHFSYFKEEGGEMMGSVLLEHITTVSLNTGDFKTFRVVSNERFTVTGSYEVLCRCENQSVRNK